MGSKTKKEQLFDNIKLYIKNNPSFNNKELADMMILEGNNCGYGFRSLQSTYIRQCKIEMQNTVNKVTPKPVIVNDDDVEDNSDAIGSGASKTGIELDPDDSMNENGYSVNDKALILAAYTKAGANLTWAQVLNLNLMANDVANEIRKTDGVTKDSEPYPIIWNITKTQNEIQDLVADNVSTVISKYSSELSPSITGAVRQLKQEAFDAHQEKLKVKEVLDDLKSLLKDIDFEVIYNRTNTVDASITDINTINIIITDMHLGMTGKQFSYDTARKMLAQITERVKGIKALVKVTFLGDILHTVTGTNHKNTWQDIDIENGFGAKGIIRAYEVILEFLLSLNNLKTVNMVGGNHDRLTSDRDEDQDDGGAHIIAAMLNISLPKVDVMFSPEVLIEDINNIRTINRHGDLRADNQPVKDIVMECGDLSKFNILNVGHLHHPYINSKDQGNNYMKIGWPAFCPKDKYAVRGGFSNPFSGYGLIWDSGFGKPVISFIPLNPDV